MKTPFTRNTIIEHIKGTTNLKYYLDTYNMLRAHRDKLTKDYNKSGSDHIREERYQIIREMERIEMMRVIEE